MLIIDKFTNFNGVKMREKLTVLVVTVLLVSGLTASYYLLNIYSRDENDSEEEAKYDPTESDLNNLVEGNNEFAFDLYHELDTDENQFYSPWSISSALAMTYEGARGETAEEMKEVFGFPDNRSQMREAYGFMHNRYNTDDMGIEMDTANSAWINEDQEFPILDEYKFVLMDYYFSEVSTVDFINQPAEACEEINNWVYNNTDGKIEEIITVDDIDEWTRLVLVNAINFKGNWAVPFDEDNTQDATFNTNQDEEVTAPFMRQEGTFNYTKNENFEILQKNYEGNETSMLFVLPRKNSIDEVEDMITTENLEEWREDLEPTEMKLVSIPKFNLSTEYDLKEPLKEMGMPTAFTPDADLSGMDGTESLFIQFVNHKTFIEVDEKGTEAAAATAVGVGRESADRRPAFIADRPFLSIIQDDETGNILFMGQVNDPTE